MVDLKTKIKNLEHQIQVLTEENSQLAERAEDSLLLGLISESVTGLNDINDIFATALEQISILKGIPFATCGQLVNGRVNVIASYCSFSDDPQCGQPLAVSDEVLSELKFGPTVINASTDLQYSFDKKAFVPTMCIGVPFSSYQIPEALFLFIDNSPDTERLPSMLMLLNQAIELVVAKYDNLFLLEALQKGNKELEVRVKERTEELTMANEALSRSELKYRQLIENALDSIFVAQNGKIVFANNNTSRFLGYSHSELYSTPFLEFVHPDFRDIVIKNHTQRLQGNPNSPSTYIFKALTKDGTELTVQIGAVKVDWNGQPATLNYARDITEQIRMEESLQQARKMEAIGQLASGIAHDFNNMLGGIIGAAEMLGLYLPEDPKIRKFHRMILESAGRAGNLTGKLLSFSRHNPQINTAVDVHELISETVILLENTIDPRIKIETDLKADMSSVKGDPPQLQNIFLNLGINASHAMPAGGTITISTTVTELDAIYCDSSTFDLKPGNYMEIDIADTGFGISPENLSRIFEPFFTTKEQGQGTGLGLASVYGTVQQHNGAITAYSEIGRGSSFYILLPLADHKALAAQKHSTVLRGSGRILVIDDEEVMRVTVQAALEELGYNVTVADNGQQGVEIYERTREGFDLVLLDMVMPIMNGYDCFEALKKINPEVRVILTSGFSRENDLREMRAAGLKGFVRKPYRRSVLSQVIHEALNP